MHIRLSILTPKRTACARPQPTFLIEASGGPADGMFATLVSNGADGYTDGGTDHVVDFTSKADAETFYLNKAGNLVSADKLIANQDSDAEEEPLYFNTVSEDKEGDVYPGPYAPASCAVLGTALTCQDAGSTVLQYCPAEISSLGSPVVLYTSLDPACDPFAFKIVPLCTIIA
jgi:hypothetical protein